MKQLAILPTGAPLFIGFSYSFTSKIWTTMTTSFCKPYSRFFIKPLLLLLVVYYSVSVHAQLNSNAPTALSIIDNNTTLISMSTQSPKTKHQVLGSNLLLNYSNVASSLYDSIKTPTKIEQDIVTVSVTPSGTISLIGENLPQLVFGQPDEDFHSEIVSSELEECHCFGKVTADCYSTGALGANYSFPCKTQGHQNDCCGRVKNAIAALSAAQKQNIADCLCNKGVADNTSIFATAAVATSSYEQCSGAIGTLHQKPAYSVTTCKCPKGWLSDNNVDGGVTSDGKCKKLVCGPWDAIAFPPPPGGTFIGTWGFFWKNELWAFGTTANGGVPICTTVNYPKGPCTMTW